MTIAWSERAKAQIAEAHDYTLATNGAAIALDVTRRVVQHVEQLASFPLSGRAGRITGTRELVIPNTPFVVAYAVEPNRVLILAVYHGAQRWPDVL